MNNDTLYVIYSSDDNYAQHMGVSIYSLLNCNKDFKKIHIFIIENKISVDNKEKITFLIKSFLNADITWIDFSKWSHKLQLNMSWKIALSSYARLFVASMIPSDIERVIYLDCDMIICDSLKDLWIWTLNGQVIGAVQDAVSGHVKESVEIESTSKYFNAGMLLIDLKKWREDEIETKCLRFIEAHKGRVIHHDQGVLNGVLSKKVCILPLKYNIMTIHYIYNRSKILKYYHEEAEFYPDEEICTAKNKPVILHYTPSFTCRPWVKGCKHPMKNSYLDALQMTPWKENKLSKSKDKWYVKLINWRYRNLPLFK
jgi:lipopolysaccharide biosynthesis glycosyltransferase